MALNLPIGQIRLKHLAWEVRNLLTGGGGGSFINTASTGGNSELIEVPLCKAATTGNITLSGNPIIDTVSLTDGDLLLVWQQTDKTENGIYRVNSLGWSRFEQTLQSGMPVMVREGALYRDTMFFLTSDSFVVGTDDIEFSLRLPYTSTNGLPIINNNGNNEFAKLSLFNILEILETDFTGKDGYVLTVNESSGGVEFTELSSGSGGTIQDATDLWIRAADEGAIAGNARGNGSFDVQTSRGSANQVASGTNSVLTGGVNNKATANYSGVHCGSDNTSAESGAFIGGGGNNTNNSQNGFIGSGLNNVNNSGSRGAICSGVANTINTQGQDSFIGSGAVNVVNSSHSAIPSGFRLETNYKGELASGYNAATGKKRQNSHLSWQAVTSDNVNYTNLTLNGTDEFTLIPNTYYHLRVHIFGVDTITQATEVKEVDISVRYESGVFYYLGLTVGTFSSPVSVFDWNVDIVSNTLKIQVLNDNANQCIYQANATILQTIEV